MISIIIPVYKVENYLRQCLDSVLAQTYTDFEVICVNDGSPDGCLQILLEYQKRDKRIKVFSQENQGLSAARNTGLDHARGEYIAFVDSDDIIDPTFLSELITHMDGDDTVDCAEVGLKHFKDEAELSNYKQRNWLNRFCFNRAGILPVMPSVFPKVFGACWNKLYRRSIIDEFHLRFLVGLIHEDKYFTYAYLSHCKNVAEVGKKLYLWRNRLGSLSKNETYEHYLDIIKNYVAFAEHLAEYGLVKRFRWACLWSFIFHSSLEARMICNPVEATRLLQRFAYVLGFGAERILAAIGPKPLAVRIVDESGVGNSFRVVSHSPGARRVYGKYELTVRNVPRSFTFTFDTKMAGMVRLFFGVVNVPVRCVRRPPEVKILVRQIFINGKMVGENITLGKNEIKSILLRAKPGGRTIVEVKV